MSTRGAYGFHKGGLDKITYNHHDSYPEVLGKVMIDFCNNTSKDTMHDIFDKIVLVQEDTMPSLEQIEECLEHYNESVGTGAPTDWYSLLRGAQGRPEAYREGLRYMIDSSGFMKDSLFCEWAYIINLDTNTLEVYVGFQKEPQCNRYEIGIPDHSGYYNVGLLTEISLDDIPTDRHKKLELLEGLEKLDQARFA